MSGHSKWSTIKRKKGATDQQRGKIFTKLAHDITVAVREGGGGDPASNARLRVAIEKAKTSSLPKENIERAIKRATGELKGDDSVETSYEGYGPGGTAVLVDVVTDNKNRTVSEIRHAFSRSGGALGETGCVGWMFKTKGLIVIQAKLIDEDKLMEVAIEAGAEDVSREGEVWEVTCEPVDFENVRTTLEKIVKLEEAEVQKLPSTRIALEGEKAQQMIRLLDLLEDLEDVINVFSNCDIEEEN